LTALKTGGLGTVGVLIPIGIEMGVKGRRVGPVKWSGVAGIVEGVVGIGGAWLSQTGRALRGMREDNRAALAAFGGGGLGVGLGIIALDELRKRALYEFQRKHGRVPESISLIEGARGGFPRMEEETPTAPLVEEI